METYHTDTTPWYLKYCREGGETEAPHLRKAYDRSVPHRSLRMSFISISDEVSIPFETDRIGVPDGMCCTT